MGGLGPDVDGIGNHPMRRDRRRGEHPAMVEQPAAPSSSPVVTGRRTFLVERFWPGVTPELARQASGRLRDAAAAERLGSPVITALLSDDEVLVAIVDAASAADARALAERAAFEPDRISEGLAFDGGSYVR